MLILISIIYRAYKCGVSRSASSRVMGGLDAGYGQFPWTAHIKIRGPHGIDKASEALPVSCILLL